MTDTIAWQATAHMHYYIFPCAEFLVQSSEEMTGVAMGVIGTDTEGRVCVGKIQRKRQHKLACATFVARSSS